MAEASRIPSSSVTKLIRCKVLQALLVNATGGEGALKEVLFLPLVRHKSSTSDPARDFSSLPFDQKKDESINTRGFGAGGLPPLMFSHLQKNWSLDRDHTFRDVDNPTTPLSSRRKRKKGWSSFMVDKRARRTGASGVRGEVEGGVVEEEEVHYGPGDGLLAIPHHQQTNEALWAEHWPGAFMGEEREVGRVNGGEDELCGVEKGEELVSHSARGEELVSH